MFLKCFVMVILLMPLAAQAEALRNERTTAGAETMTTENNSKQGLRITFDQASYKATQNMTINGVFATFVNCGSQYALWHQFPLGINFQLKDLDSGEIYTSVNRELSISWNGDEVYQQYAKKPCNTVVSQDFSIALKEIFFKDLPNKEIKNFELRADYAGYLSNVLIFKDLPLR